MAATDSGAAPTSSRAVNSIEPATILSMRRKESSMTGAGISTHVLDTSRGAPAAGVAITVYRREGRELVAAGSGTTGEDGRVANLLDGELRPGWYQPGLSSPS